MKFTIPTPSFRPHARHSNATRSPSPFYVCRSNARLRALEKGHSHPAALAPKSARRSTRAIQEANEAPYVSLADAPMAVS